MYLQIYKILSNFEKILKMAQTLQKVIVFFLQRGEEIEPSFWHIWTAQWLNFFPSFAYLFRFRLGWKRQTLGPSLYHENSNPSNFFQTVLFFFFRVLLLVRILAILHHFGDSKGPITSHKGHFMVDESLCKTLKTFDLTTTNAILMKLTKIIYLHESVNQKPRRARNSVFWRNV